MVSRTLLLMNVLNVLLKILSIKIKTATPPPNKQAFFKLFYPNQMYYNYKLDEDILKTLI